jgi:glycosyltransferase involved in cell wall biosynthesis
MPTLSVISGAYNLADCKYFEKSLTSLTAQTYRDIEIILCDDGSTDGTYEILKRFAETDDRIKLIRNETNLGLVKTLNRCLSLAEGKYIARHDCDDYNDLTRFEKQVAYLEAHPSLGILGTSAYLFDDNGVFAVDTMPRVVKKSDFLFNNPYKHGSVIFRREAILRADGYRVAKETVRNEDYDLFMRIHTFTEGENLDEPLYYFLEDDAARKRRKYRYRINEAKVRLRGFKSLGLMPKGLLYVIKPLIVGLLPGFVLRKLQEKRRKKRQNGREGNEK